MTLQIGFGTRDITPPLRLPMGGYAARTGVAEGVLDPLWCRVAVLSSREACAAIVVLDWVYVSKAWSDAVRNDVSRRLGCSAASVLVAATHTHAGPAVFRSGPHPAEGIASYETSAAAAVLAAAEEARSRLQPVELSYGRAEIDGVAANRRAISEATERSVDVLETRNSSGERTGVIASFGCHPTVLSASNLLYSADLFGAAIAEAERRLGATLVLCNGAAGDVSTRFTRAEQTVAEVKRLGAILGEGIARACAIAAPIVSEPLRAATENLPIQMRPLPSVETAQELVAKAAAELQKVQADADAVRSEKRLAASLLEGALAQLFLATRGGVEGLVGRVPTNAELQRFEVGDVQFIGVPGELFSSAAMQLRSARRRPLLIIGYANDYLGYFVPKAAAAAGGYESLIAVVAPTSADAMAQRLAAIAGE